MAPDGVNAGDREGAGEDLTGAVAWPVPTVTDGVTVIVPQGAGVGHWAGAPSAVLVGGTTYLAYRLRRPLGEGRGVVNVVAASEDGVRFETLLTLGRELFDAESLERPALLEAPTGEWRLYVSCATPDSAHWRVECLTAPTPQALADGERQVVFNAPDIALKDPVIRAPRTSGGRWRAWVCCHPLDDPTATDRMWTEEAESEDGLSWARTGIAIAPTGAGWDARGRRIADVLEGNGREMALYDGRATAEENFEERTGVAMRDESGRFQAVGDSPAGQSPWGGGGLRYVSLVRHPDDRFAVYYECARPDGAHELRMEWRRPPS